MVPHIEPGWVHIVKPTPNLGVHLEMIGIRKILNRVHDNQFANDSKFHSFLAGQVVVLHSSYSFSLRCHTTLALCSGTNLSAFLLCRVNSFKATSGMIQQPLAQLPSFLQIHIWNMKIYLLILGKEEIILKLNSWLNENPITEISY